MPIQTIDDIWGDMVYPEVLSDNAPRCALCKEEWFDWEDLAEYWIEQCIDDDVMIHPDLVKKIVDTVNAPTDFTFAQCLGIYVPKVWGHRIKTYYSADPIIHEITLSHHGQFNECKHIKSVIIPDDWEAIFENEFESCTSLVSVVIPEGVTEIGNCAFDNCESLTSVVIPDTVTDIGYAAFRGCTSLKSIVIPDSVTEIGPYAFAGCTSLTKVKLPDDVIIDEHTTFDLDMKEEIF